MTVREGLHIDIGGIPAENGKCRVETQLKIPFSLKNAQGQNVQDWKMLRLPRMLLVKEKNRMEENNNRKNALDSEILTLEARLVCDHDMTKVLAACDNCIGREQKRAGRSKKSQIAGEAAAAAAEAAKSGDDPFQSAISGQGHTQASSLPTPTDPAERLAWERSRILVFSGTEYVDFSKGELVLSTRITCYCRHHNERVGFRIQFRLRDSTGAIVASVLTNPVMMMDDHKSGKRTGPSLAKSGSATKANSKASAGASSTADNQNRSAPNGYQEHGEDQADIEQDDESEGEGEIDLESGQHIPHKSRQEFIHIGTKRDMIGDSEALSGDVLSPLTPTGRLGSKRRVDDNMMDDIQTHSTLDPSRGPFRRKTSHDIMQGTMGQSFTSSNIAFSPSKMDALASPSPFMPGSPFANDDTNVFAPSFSQALGSNGSLLDQKNMDMFLKGDLSAHIPVSQSSQRNGSIHIANHDMSDTELHEDSTSMMETFTNLDEAMGSPPNAFQSASLSPVDSETNHRGIQDQVSLPSTSQALATRASFSIPTTIPTETSDAAISSKSFAVPSSTSFVSPFTTTFSSPLNGAAATTMVSAPSMASSFLDASQMQEFQNFKRQSLIQQQQQNLLMQLQQGVHKQGQKQMEPTQVPWTSVKSESKDPLWNMKTAMAQTTSPASSAFIPVPTAFPDSASKQSSSPLSPSKIDENDTAAAPDAAPAPKRRGRPRKTALPSTSEANSPVLSPKLPSTVPPSPSPPPHLAPPSASAASAAAAQFLLFQQRQQQQLQQHHQQQLQQQQKQAILARQKPRVQKLIPSRGPIEGGAEITLLGSGFFPGMVPTFDGVPALNVQYYGPETVICRLPPRGFPGTVVVKAQQSPMGAGSSAGVVGTGAGADDANSSDLVRTMTQLFGGPSNQQHTGLVLSDDDVGVLFEYEENKGDRDLIALALQVLGMKMNGRVEPPHQVAMRIMGTAAASNAVMGSQGSGLAQIQPGGSSTSLALQTPQNQLQSLQHHQQQQQQQQQQQSILQFGGMPPSNGFQANPFQQQLQLQQQQQRQQQQLQQHQQQQQQQSVFNTVQNHNPDVLNGSLANLGGFENFMSSMSGSKGGSQ